MTDDLVARAQEAIEQWRELDDDENAELTLELVNTIEAERVARAKAEARVRELESELADQQVIAKYNREQAEKVERALEGSEK